MDPTRAHCKLTAEEEKHLNGTRALRGFLGLGGVAHGANVIIGQVRAVGAVARGVCAAGVQVQSPRKVHAGLVAHPELV